MADDEHNVTININGNANVAVNSLNKVRGALASLENGVKLVSGALAKLNWVVQSVQMIIRGVEWLRDKLTETARFVAKLKWDIEMRAADAAELGAAETDRERAAVYGRRERRETAAFDAAKAKVEAETAKSVGERDETMIARWREDMARAPD